MITSLPFSEAFTLFINQGRSHQIWNDQVGSARARTLYPSYTLGGPGGMLPQENFEI